MTTRAVRRMLAFALATATSLVLAAACSDAGTQSSQSLTPPTQAEVAAAAPGGGSTTDIATTMLSNSQPGFIGNGELRVPNSSIAPGPMRMIVVIDGENVHLRNGGQVLLRDGLALELFVDPYPPNTLRAWLDVYITRDGVPVEDADLQLDYDMLAMAHGPFSTDGENIGNGHYLFTLDYGMYGAWNQLVRVRTDERSIVIPLVLVTFP